MAIEGTGGPDNLQGTGDPDTINGGAGNDTLMGLNGNDVLNGGLDADLMVGGFGSDTYHVDNVGDRVLESNVEAGDSVLASVNFSLPNYVEHLSFEQASGNFRGFGNTLNNSLTGGGGNDLLDGDSGKDTLKGGAGIDRLVGGAHQDELWGQGGADLFRFVAYTDTSAVNLLWDQVMDFSISDGDKIDLQMMDPTTLVAGFQNTGFSFVTTFTQAGQVRWDNTNKILYGNVNSDLNADFGIKLVNFIGTITDANIILKDVTPPVIISSNTPSLAENTASGKAVYTAEVDDGPATFSLLPGGDSAQFAINTTTGVVTTKFVPNYEPPGQTSYTFTVKATDQAGHTGTQTVTLSIINVDEKAPEITSGDATAPENGTFVYQAAGHDTLDGASHAITWSISGKDAGLLNINASTGEVTLKTGTTQYEGGQTKYEFTLSASDTVNAPTLKNVKVDITDVNEKPTNLSVTPSSINENVSGTSESVYVGDIAATDPDTLTPAFQVNSFSIGSSYTDTFEIKDGNKLYYKGSAQDYEAMQTKSLTVTVIANEGNASLEFSKNLTIAVNDVNELPTISGTVTGSVTEAGDEDNGTDVPGTSVASSVLVGSDPENATLVWSGNSTGTYGSFVVSNGTWTYTLANGDEDTQQLRENESDTESFTVVLSDGTNGVSEIVTITVNGTNDAPTAAADTASVNEDQTTSGSLKANDGDVDASATLTYTVTSETPGFSFTESGSWEFDASNAAYQGLDNEQTTEVVINYVVTDEFGASAASTLTVTVHGQDDVLTITGDTSGEVIEAGDDDDGTDEPGTPQTSGTLTTENSEGTLQWSSDTAGSYGTFSVSEGVWTYVLDNGDGDTKALAEGQSEVDVFMVTVEDDEASDTETVSVTVHGANDQPLATADTAVVAEDAAVTSGSVAGNDSDVDAGATLTYTFTATPGLTPSTNGHWEFDASNAAYQSIAEGVSHAVVVDYVVKDEFDASTASTLTITVVGENDTPTISGTFSGSVTEAGDLDDGSDVAGTPVVSGQLYGIDPDDGATEAWTSTGTSSYGSFSVDGVGKWTYTLDNDDGDTKGLYEGLSVTEQFTVVLSDGMASSAQTITLTIVGTNDAPTASAATDGGNEGTTISGDLAAETDDVDSNASLSFTAGSASGLLVQNDGDYSLDASHAAYEHIAYGASEVVSVTYVVTDDKMASAAATLDITVYGQNDTPTISGTLTGTAIEAGDLDNGTDVGGTAVVSGQLYGDDPDDGATEAWTSTGTSSYGSFAVDGNGKWTYTLDNDDGDTKALYEGHSVTEQFSVVLSDGMASSAQTITVTIVGTNDQPIAGADTKVVQEDATTNGSVAGNDSDVDAGATLTYSFTATAGLTPNADGSWDFNAGNASYQSIAEGVSQAVVINYVVKDEFGASTGSTLTVTVVGKNDTPEITGGPQSGSVTEESTTPATGTFSRTDDTGDTQSWSGTQVTSYGTFTVTAGTGAWNYTLDNSSTFEDKLSQGVSIVENFTVTVKDGLNASDTETVAITVHGLNDAPTITSGAQSGTVTEDGTQVVSGDVNANDVDDISTLTYTGGATSSYGTLVVTSGTGEWTYTLNNSASIVQNLTAAQSVTDSFTVIVTDDKGATATQAVNIKVMGANEPVSNTAPDIKAGPTFSSTQITITVDDDDTQTIALYSGSTPLGTLSDNSSTPVAVPSALVGSVQSGNLTVKDNASTPGVSDTGYTLVVGSTAADTGSSLTASSFTAIDPATERKYAIYGAGGNDSIVGSAQIDYMDGGGDNDTLTGGAGADSLNGGSETDTVSYADVTSSSAHGLTNVAGVAVNLTGSTITAATIATAMGGSVVLGGGNAVAGSDLAAGTAGYLATSGGNSTTTMVRDTLTGLEAVIGSTLADYISLGTGANSVTGGQGGDVIDLGSDSSADRVIFTASNQGSTLGSTGGVSGYDKVANFTAADDSVVIAGALLTAIDDNASSTINATTLASGNNITMEDVELLFVTKAVNDALGSSQKANLSNIANVNRISTLMDTVIGTISDGGAEATAQTVLFVIEAADTTGTFGVYAWTQIDGSDTSITNSEIVVLGVITGNSVSTADFIAG